MSRQFRRSFLALFIPLALLVVLAAVYLFNQAVANQKAILSTDGSLDVVSGGRAIERSLDASVQDVLYLASLPELTAMRKVTRSGMQDLSRAFILFCLTHPAYSKLRLIDADGKEVLRITSLDGRVSVTDQDQLENKSDRFYFTGSVRLSPGKVYVSPMQLEYENRQVITPHLPIIRIATPVFAPPRGAGRHRGRQRTAGPDRRQERRLDQPEHVAEQRGLLAEERQSG